MFCYLCLFWLLRSQERKMKHLSQQLLCYNPDRERENVLLKSYFAYLKETVVLCERALRNGFVFQRQRPLTPVNYIVQGRGLRMWAADVQQMGSSLAAWLPRTGKRNKTWNVTYGGDTALSEPDALGDLRWAPLHGCLWLIPHTMAREVLPTQLGWRNSELFSPPLTGIDFYQISFHFRKYRNVAFHAVLGCGIFLPVP